MSESYNSKLQRQLLIEKEALADSLEDYQNISQKLIRKGSGHATRIGRDFLVTIVEPLTEFIVSEFERRRQGHTSLATKFIASFPPEKLAYLGARHLIDGALASDQLVKRASLLGEDMVYQANAQKLEWHESGAYKAMLRRMNKAPSDYLKKKVQKCFYDRWYKDQIDPIVMEKKDRIQAGIVVLHYASVIAGKWIQRVPYKPKKHTTYKLSLTPEMLTEATKREKIGAITTLKHPIFIVPPKDWTGIFSGPYYTKELNRRARLIRSYDYDYLKEMNSRISEYPKMIEAVNAVQKIAWRVNHSILGVMQECIERGGGKKWALPIINKSDLPPIKGLKVGSYEFKKAQKARCDMISQFAQLRGIMDVAFDYCCESEMYFGYALDTRGRGYPVYGGRFLSPQSSDISKGLLEFSHGERIGSSEAMDWLLYGAANAYGIDKVSRSERIAWTEEHAEAMAACADDPFDTDNRKFWISADSPWEFLAFCFEVRGALQDGDDHICRMPIMQDGCQNALQHVAGQMKCADLAVRCSVIPDGNDKPRDLYQEVADCANELIKDAAVSDTRSTEELTQLGEAIRVKILDKNRNDSTTWSKRLTDIDKALMPRLLSGGVVDRSMCKRPVMTATYDVSNYTRKEQISDAIITGIEKHGNEYAINDDLRWRATMFLEPLVREATAMIITSAYRYLDWLKGICDIVTERQECSVCPDCGKKQCECVCCKTKTAQRKRRLRCACYQKSLRLEWKTPLGFPVIHDKKETVITNIKTVIGDHKIKTSVRDDTAVIDRSKMRLGVCANYTHSFDAAMLWDVVARMSPTPVNIIHDSFGTLPSKSTELADTLRQTYVDMYAEQNHLENLYRSCFKNLCDLGRDDQAFRLPESPAMGNLNVNDALNSTYIFS